MERSLGRKRRPRLLTLWLLFCGCISIPFGGDLSGKAAAQELLGSPDQANRAARGAQAIRGLGDSPGPFGFNLLGSTSIGGGLDLSQVQLRGRAVLPLDPPRRMMMILPSFTFTALDADSMFETPTELYSLGLNMTWMERLSDRMLLSLSLNPSINGDANSIGNEVRVFSFGMLRWQAIPDRLTWIFGAAYTGREDIPVLPMAGVQWRPTEDWDVSLVLPQPKVSYRLKGGPGGQLWIYGRGGVGGGTWDVAGQNNSDDELSATEFQASLGINFINYRRKHLFAEIGAGFGREIKFESTAQNQSFGNSLLIRGGWNY
ncbi:MAG: DUF6268 family outer membrane beta-barrel protein [Planctomycetota bacterium]